MNQVNSPHRDIPIDTAKEGIPEDLNISGTASLSSNEQEEDEPKAEEPAEGEVSRSRE